jgi:hypothetical protein
MGSEVLWKGKGFQMSLRCKILLVESASALAHNTMKFLLRKSLLNPAKCEPIIPTVGMQSV